MSDRGQQDGTESEQHLHCRCMGHGAPEVVDPCIRELVDCLNRHGVKTYSSCCGHGTSPGYIGVEAECIERAPDGGYLLRLDTKPVRHPYSGDELAWPGGDGKPWHAFCRELIRGLRGVLEPEVLRAELLDDD